MDKHTLTENTKRLDSSRYSRQAPSEDYSSLSEQYSLLYSKTGSKLTNGKELKPEEMFANGEFGKEADTIKTLMYIHSCRSILNFGCGNPDAFFKHKFIDRKTTVIEDAVEKNPIWDSIYDFLGRPYVKMYDPGIEALNTYPDFPSEMVVCTDVLEHIPEQDIPWFLDELLKLTTKVLHVSIHLGPAVTILPDGRNAHVCIKPREWWLWKLQQAQDRARHYVRVSTVYRYPVSAPGVYTDIDYAKY
jgi:hypothetical protein